MLQRLEVIDFLRGFSIFTIVLMHLLQSFPISPFLMAASSFGGAGVHVRGEKRSVSICGRSENE